ncbi:hypothetical protein ACFV1W_37340 [Kitasatospora sp. NPDC059648]|uniref:hypothetical protein n=1 Tax=Kitasatospora sp. NPDC059648 TaxID=3346894 RepID=UPI0036B03F9D
MAGTVVVHAESPVVALRRGCYRVVIDGVLVGRVGRGATARFPVPAGTHTVRIAAGDRTRSNTVSVEVAEDRECLVTSRSTGLKYALLVPPLAPVAMVPAYYVFALVLLMGAVFWAVPGLLLRLRTVGDCVLPGARTTGRADPAGEEHGGNGLWWESDRAAVGGRSPGPTATTTRPCRTTDPTPPGWRWLPPGPRWSRSWASRRARAL